ncbi:MAG: nitrous oxide-stimulated promoter family protein [Spirochaetales bacterium]|nr:nitrous oxide-stimulated promoter family protein [Spirochaetales bacterium]
MIRVYCRARHPATGRSPCPDCVALEKYAHQRLLQCPFREAKPVCSDCTVHCYSKTMREKIRAVMRFAGPRMILRHPMLAFVHLFRKIISRVR